MKNLAKLKADCILARGLTETYPDNQHYARAYELIQRKIQAMETELFCNIEAE